MRLRYRGKERKKKCCWQKEKLRKTLTYVEWIREVEGSSNLMGEDIRQRSSYKGRKGGGYNWEIGRSDKILSLGKLKTEKKLNSYSWGKGN